MRAVTKLARQIAEEVWEHYEIEFTLDPVDKDETVMETAKIIEATLERYRED